MEFGPRALGARSILAAPGDVTTRERVNGKVKRRELFRPLAPAVTAEAADDYFDLNPAGTALYSYMLATAPVRPEMRAMLQAVTHVDGSARVQTVSRKTSPLFHRLIEAYAELSGLPVLLNTSFNHSDEPIVCTPDDAVRTYMRCNLDALVIGHHIVEPPAWPER